MLALAAAGILGGVSFLFGKWALEEMGPAHLTLLRFAIARRRCCRTPSSRECGLDSATWLCSCWVGLLSVPATFLVQFWGLSLTSATVAALIVGCGPPMIAFFGRLFLKEKLGKAGWAALGASTVGVALTIARPRAGNDWLGDALVLLSLLAVVGCCSASASTKNTRRLPPPLGYSPSVR